MDSRVTAAESNHRYQDEDDPEIGNDHNVNPSASIMQDTNNNDSAQQSGEMIENDIKAVAAFDKYSSSSSSITLNNHQQIKKKTI